jgi:hypothetical protein
MTRRTIKYVPQCDVCTRPMNESSDLTHMRKPGVLEPLRICSVSRCWKKAAEGGYTSLHGGA